MKSILGTSLINKHQANKIIPYIANNNIAILDFSDIEYVSHSFLRPIFYHCKNNKITIKCINIPCKINDTIQIFLLNSGYDYFGSCLML